MWAACRQPRVLPGRRGAAHARAAFRFPAGGGGPLPSPWHRTHVLFCPPWQEEEGPLGLWLTYLLAGVGGTVASYLTSPHTHTISLGASGAVFGLFMVGCREWGRRASRKWVGCEPCVQRGAQARQSGASRRDGAGNAWSHACRCRNLGLALLSGPHPPAAPHAHPLPPSLPPPPTPHPAGVGNSQVQAQPEAAAGVRHPGTVCSAAGGEPGHRVRLAGHVRHRSSNLAL